jgi:lysyl-tRNA synthetase class 1
MSARQQASHWADQHAQNIIRRTPEAEHYTCASGITPSGTVHIGNFREIISVDLIVRALRDHGKKVRFIYSWDDYDVFRKVPQNLPNADRFQDYLRQPIVLIPDPWGETESYARAHETRLERELPTVGIEPEYIYQAERYRASTYAEGMRTALEHRESIRGILDQHRTEPLPENWWPVSVFSSFTNRDTTEVVSWDGAYGVTYRCLDTDNEETIDLRSTPNAKLFWRIDWPMRWSYEQVDFEPAGKEHHSAGGSFDTGKEIAREVYGFEAPHSFKYDFISIKGRGGKISSSSGDVIGLDEVLEVYQPEVVRYLFAGTRPNAEFAISFDLDVIKIYEDYDKCERIYYGQEEVGEKRKAKEGRIYELSQTAAPDRENLGEKPTQIPFRHLCNLLQITNGDVELAFETFERDYPLSEADKARLRVRARCAWNWITRFAPEDFRFRLNDGSEAPVELEAAELSALRTLRAEIADRFDEHDEQTLSQRIYDIAREAEIEPKQFFKAMYRVLIDQEQGPRLAGFLRTVGRDRVLQILEQY